MSTLGLDPVTGDLAVANNRLSMLTGPDEVTQRLSCRLRMIRGEWFLNPAKGVPYRETIWVKGVSPTQKDAAFKREILTVPGVLELQAFQSTLGSTQRLLAVTFTAKATTGDVITYTEVLPT